MISLSLKQARHAAVASQQYGIAKTDRTPSSTYSALNHLGYVQIDTISVVDRAHHHILRSRHPKYTSDCLHSLQGDQAKVFEYWAHAMAYLPMEDYRYYIPTMERFRKPKGSWDSERYKICKPLLKPVLKRIRDEGPLSSKDFEKAKTKPNNKQGTHEGWWNHKPAKIALEWLFWRGDLMVKERRGFQRVFELTERFLPDDLNLTVPPEDERAIWQINRALNVLGVAEEKSILQYLSVAHSKLVRKVLSEGVEEGRWELVQVKGKENCVFYGLPKRIAQVLKEKLPTANRALLLSPFDNHVINRDRAEQLFDFNYRIECYTPAAKRQYGYFSLPILFQEKLIGRADTKAHRKENLFEVKNLVLEAGTKVTQTLISALAKGIRTFAKDQACPEIKLTQVDPKPLMEPLHKELF